MSDNKFDKYLSVEEKEVAGEGNQRQPSRSPSPRRQSHESSPNHSDYDEEDLGPIKTNPKQTIDCFNTKSGWNIRLKTPEGVCLYFVDNSIMTPKKPDVTFHRGSDKTDPIVGVCKWRSMYSKEILVGLGDPSNNEANVVWGELKSQQRAAFHREFDYRFKLESGDGSAPREFAWQRAHKEDRAGGDYNSLSSKNFKLVNVQSGDTVALFGSNRFKSWHKLGKFTFYGDYGERWLLMSLLTGLALVEMSRRRSRSRRSAGGGGGGSGGG